MNSKSKTPNNVVVSYAFNVEATDDGVVVSVEFADPRLPKSIKEMYVITRDDSGKQSEIIADTMIATVVDQLTDRLLRLHKMMELANKLK